MRETPGSRSQTFVRTAKPSGSSLRARATALEHGYVLGTGNASHFSWIPGLTLDD